MQALFLVKSDFIFLHFKWAIITQEPTCILFLQKERGIIKNNLKSKIDLICCSISQLGIFSWKNISIFSLSLSFLCSKKMEREECSGRIRQLGGWSGRTHIACSRNTGPWVHKGEQYQCKYNICTSAFDIRGKYTLPNFSILIFIHLGNTVVCKAFFVY